MNPETPDNLVGAQKSIFIQPLKGFVEPSDFVVIPCSLTDPILEHLRKYHGVTAETMYNDLHSFIRYHKVHEALL